jgi:dGTPase
MRAQGLASYATNPQCSRGRRHPEPASHPQENRSAFQRDRDRIVHSTAFRRLVYKTQVFLNHEGDLFRTRMTHSLEVAQLARSIARHLQLNEDLVEAVALAHDLGHTPFGHAGQDALNACMKDHGGFEHNLQSLRVVDVLEHRYPQFDGLNLSLETREGILKHCSVTAARQIEQAEPRGVAHRFLHGGSPGLEAQLANLADEIAYNAHDIDDGVRSGLLQLEQMQQQPLFGEFLAQAKQAYPALGVGQGRRLLFEAVRRMLSSLVYDVMSATSTAIASAGVNSVDDVRCSRPLVVFSAQVRRECTELKRFLFANLYRHAQVTHTTLLAQQVIQELFESYCADSAQLPPEYQERWRSQGQPLYRVVCDYIAGMTDRFALKEHIRLTGQALFAEPVAGALGN